MRCQRSASFLALLLFIFLFAGESLALGPSIVGKWRLKPGKGGRELIAIVTFLSNKTGKMLMKQGKMSAEQHFRYRMARDTITMTATKLVYNGKQRPVPKKKIVLKLKWMGRDRVQTQEMEGGSLRSQIDVLVRMK